MSELPWTLLAGLLSYSFQAILQQQAHKCLELHWEITSKFFWNIMNKINVHLSLSKIHWIYHCYILRITMNENNIKLGWISRQVRNLNYSSNVWNTRILFNIGDGSNTWYNAAALATRNIYCLPGKGREKCSIKTRNVSIMVLW